MNVYTTETTISGFPLTYDKQANGNWGPLDTVKVVLARVKVAKLSSPNKNANSNFTTSFQSKQKELQPGLFPDPCE